MTSASRATVQVLGTMSVDTAIRNELSPMGDLFFQVGAASYEMAAGGKVDIGEVVQLSAKVIDGLGVKASELLVSVLGDLGEDVAAAVGAASSALGPVGAAMAAVLVTGLKVSAAYTQSAREGAAKACQASYKPPGPPTRATAYGGLLPCDFLNGSVGRVFQDVGERNCHFETVAGYQVLVCGGSNRGIPVGTRHLLKQMREAIQSARGDPKSDGGLTLWPVYIDLLRAQFDRGHIDWKLAGWIYDCETLPPYLYYPSGAAAGEWQRCKCRSYETRAWQEFAQVMTDWKLTIEPVYAMDQPKAAALRQKVAAALARIKGERGSYLSAAAAGKLSKTIGPALRREPARPVVVGAAAGAVAVGSWMLWGHVARAMVRRLL